MKAAAAPRTRTLQRWMQAVVMHPGGVDRGVGSPQARRLQPRAAQDLDAVVLPSKSLAAAERLGIYAHMYWARLIEILAEEYPTTREILGVEAFERASRRFLELHPSTSQTLNNLSVGFPLFLARHLPRANRSRFAVEVARVERAMEDVFDAPAAESLAHRELAGIRGDEWDGTGLRLIPALQLLALKYPANDFMNAVGTPGKPRIPQPRADWVVVYRQDYRVFRRSLVKGQYRLLQALQAGQPLAQAVRGAMTGRRGQAEDLGELLGGWFSEWAAAGLFCGIERRPAGAKRD